MNMSEPAMKWFWHGDVYITMGRKLTLPLMHFEFSTKSVCSLDMVWWAVLNSQVLCFHWPIVKRKPLRLHSMHTSVRNKLIALFFSGCCVFGRCIFICARQVNKRPAFQSKKGLSLNLRQQTRYWWVIRFWSRLAPERLSLRSSDSHQHPYQLVNVWASWCVWNM